MVPNRSFITGATGFIGTRLVQKLIQQGHDVTCLARPTADTTHLRKIGAFIATGDITNPDSLSSALQAANPDTVFHLAGMVKAVRNRDFFAVNQDGTRNIAAACAERPTPPTLLLVSSLAAAGPGHSRTEDAPPNPVSVYGQSKLAGEQAALHQSLRVPTTIVRPPIVYGPGDQGVFQIFAPIARLRAHFIPGFHEAHFSLIFVDDLVDAIILAAHKGERLAKGAPMGQGIYYAAGEETPTYTQLGVAIAAALGQRPPTMLRMPKPLMKLAAFFADATSTVIGRSFWLNSDKITEATAGDWSCLPAKAHQQLGWRPSVSLEDHLKETALWYRQNKWL